MRKADTVSMLVEWGKWSRGGCGDLLARSPMAVTMQLVEPSNNRLSLNISDEDALRVERAVCQLFVRDPQLGHALVLYYVRGYGEVQVALDMKISRDRAGKILSRAMGWVDCCLNNISLAA